MSTPPATHIGSSNIPHSPRVDIAILTIREDEFRAVLQVFPHEPTLHRGRRYYNLRTADAGEGQKYRIAIVRQVEQGNGEAQDAARDILDELQPQLLLVVGIAGGLPSDDFTLGDVIVSTRINDYSVEARKEGEAPSYSISGGPVARAVAAGVANLPAMGRELGDWARIREERPPIDVDAAEICGPSDWQETVREKLRVHFAKDGARLPIVTAGTLASSDRLVKDPNVLFPWIQTARHILAVEMESGGVYRAVRERTLMVAIRGISDIIGLNRDDRWTKYACASAAAFACAYLRTMPVPPSVSHDPELIAIDVNHREQPPRKSEATVYQIPQGIVSVEPNHAPLLASVLIPYQAQGVFMVSTDDKDSLYNSQEGLFTLLEEFLALGCLRVAVPAGTMFANATGLPLLKERLVIVDQDRLTYKKVVSLLGPVAEELCVPEADFESTTPVLPAQAPSLINEKDPIRKQRIALLSYVFEHAYALLLGLQHQLQVSLDIGELRRQTTALREPLRNRSARLNLASLLGLLRSYEAWNIQTLEALSTEEIGRSKAFAALPRDQTFRHLSHQAHLLGVPSRAKSAADRIGKLVLEVIEHVRDAGLVSRTRLFRASSGIKEPESELEQEAFVKGFVPPIVPLKGLVWRARERWRKELPSGHVATSLVASGREHYFSDPPTMIISNLKDQHTVLVSTTPVVTNDIDLFETMMTSELDCPTHARLPQVNGRAVSGGRVELAFSFCCEDQSRLFWASMRVVGE